MSSRLRTLRTGSSRTAAYAREIRAASGSNSRKQVNHVRIAPDGVTAWDWRPDRVYLSTAQQQAVAELMRRLRPDIDWNAVSHDYHLISGMLRRSPAVGERGYTPEVEGTFGGTDPAFLPRRAEGGRAAA